MGARRFTPRRRALQDVIGAEMRAVMTVRRRSLRSATHIAPQANVLVIGALGQVRSARTATAMSLPPRRLVLRTAHGLVASARRHLSRRRKSATSLPPKNNVPLGVLGVAMNARSARRKKKKKKKKKVLCVETTA